VNELQTAMGTRFFIKARTQWKSPRSRHFRGGKHRADGGMMAGRSS
jgi:hypothetical protein